MMRNTIATALWALLAASPTSALPTIPASGVEIPEPAKVRRQSPSATPPFDAESQYVSTSGLHQWKAPGPLDERGPCPGLNAMANHGYLPRTGIAAITEYITAATKVFGMGHDLATVLAAYGAVLDGAGAIWSIGGIQHTGIGGSHNNYETDSSPMRGDLNQYGSNTNLIISQFYELYNLQSDAATANYDLSVIRDFRGTRFNESIDKNPDFYYGPFSGALVSQAAFLFIYRFMSNKSAEYPTGYLNKDVLKSFMSISGPEDNVSLSARSTGPSLVWTPGHERIPENWFTRNADDLYTVDYVGDDINYLSATQPYITQPGCNTGEVNSYTPINISAASNGAYTPAEVLANPLCFGLAYAAAMSSVLSPVNDVLAELILPIQNTLGCVTIESLNQTASEACPGYSLFGGPTGSVAMGAVQK